LHPERLAQSPTCAKQLRGSTRTGNSNQLGQTEWRPSQQSTKTGDPGSAVTQNEQYKKTGLNQTAPQVVEKSSTER